MAKREYELTVWINNRKINKLIIDNYCENNHPDITDEVIIQLVHLLDGGEYVPDEEKSSGFQYFVNDGIKLDNKTYKLIWLLKEGEMFVGVVNCYRRD